MPYFKVKIAAGAFINNVFYRQDEIVELPKGSNPNWGALCTADGVELENYNKKRVLNDNLSEHLAKTIEGDSNKEVKNLAKENAELKNTITLIQEQLADMKGSSPVTEEAIITEDVVQQVKESVDLLEDDNDDQWTGAGLPKVDVIREITGLEVNRKDIEKANPRVRKI